MQIDERFLTIHPATQAWWAQRGRCESCRHCVSGTSHEGESVMRCAATPMNHPHQGVAKMHEARGSLTYCIDARLPKQPCGPKARLWEGKR